jgi:hypothetical protein
MSLWSRDRADGQLAAVVSSTKRFRLDAKDWERPERRRQRPRAKDWDELAIFAGQTPDAALKTPATSSWLIRWPFAAMAVAMALSVSPSARSAAISRIASCSASWTSSPSSPRRNPKEPSRRDTGPWPFDPLHPPDPLPNAITFGFGEGGSDRQKQFVRTLRT